MIKDRQKTRPCVVDLFSGVGGMGLGFEQAGFDVIAAVELDPIHCAAHQFNFPDCEVICRDIRSVSGTELQRIAERDGRNIQVVIGGPPCQGFSLIGQRMFDDKRNSLVLEFVRIVAEAKADYFVFENVRGLTVGKHREFLQLLVDEFKRVGYSVRLPWHVLNAADFGVPQDRRRLFLLGARNGLPLPDYPMQSHSPRVSHAGEALPTPTVWDALGDLPDADQYKELHDSDCVRGKFKKPSQYASILRGLTRDLSDFSYPRLHDPRFLTASMRANHSEISRKRFAETKPGTTEPISRFFKLAPDGICNTLRAGTASDHGAFTSPRPIHPTYPRCITVREMARLHSYPDWFRFHVTKWHGARQIGNSVPPLLARAVARQIAAVMQYRPESPLHAVQLGNESLLRVNMQQACHHFGVPINTIPQRTRSVKTSDFFGTAA